MAEAKCVADFMVKEVSCAEPWQPVGFARQRMLVNSYSYLPIRLDGDWWLISDHAIARYLRAAEKQ